MLKILFFLFLVPFSLAQVADLPDIPETPPTITIPVPPPSESAAGGAGGAAGGEGESVLPEESVAEESGVAEEAVIADALIQTIDSERPDSSTQSTESNNVVASDPTPPPNSETLDGQTRSLFMPITILVLIFVVGMAWLYMRKKDH